MNAHDLAYRLLLQPQAAVTLSHADGNAPQPIEEKHILFNSEANAWVIEPDAPNPPAYLSMDEYEKIEGQVTKGLEALKAIARGMAVRNPVKASPEPAA